MKQIDIFGNEVDLDKIPIPQQKSSKKLKNEVAEHERICY